MQELENAFSSTKDQYSGDTLVKEVDLAAQLVDHVNVISNDMGWNFTGGKNLFSWIGPVLTSLQGNPVCDADESCSDTRGAFEQLLGGRDQADLDAINDLAHQLQEYPDKKQPEGVDGPPAWLHSRSSPACCTPWEWISPAACRRT